MSSGYQLTAEQFLRETLAGHGLLLGRYISQGSNGAVFQTSTGVAKVTWDKKEARIATWLHTNYVPYLPLVESVWARRGPSADGALADLFVIHREDLPDVVVENKALVNLQLMAGREDLRGRLSAADQALLDAVRELRTRVSEVLGTADVNIANVGVRGRQLVLRDIGSARLVAPGAGVVPAFDSWNPPGAWTGFIVGGAG